MAKKKINSRTKGATGERECAALLKKYGFEAKRGVQFGKGGHDNPDVKHNIPNTHVEVKRVESLQIYKAMEQAMGDASEGQKPVVFHRKNNKPWIVIMLAEDYLKMEGGEEIDYSSMEF